MDQFEPRERHEKDVEKGENHQLIQALNSNTIGAAALDVFEGEPNIDRILLSADNLIMLPHLGSATAETREAMGFRVLDNLEAFFDGHTPPDRVN